MSDDDKAARERDLANRVRTAFVKGTSTPPNDAPDHIKALWPRMLAGEAAAKTAINDWLRSGDRRSPVVNSRLGRPGDDEPDPKR
jgi:hypothetical protein